MMVLREAEVVFSERVIKATERIRSKRDAALIFQEMGMGKKAVEHMAVMYLNTHAICMGVEIVGKGSVDQVAVDMKSLFRGALMAGASAVILCHNHPSGNATPSEADMKITKKIQEAAAMLDLRVVDHLVLGNGYFESIFDLLRKEGS